MSISSFAARPVPSPRHLAAATCIASVARFAPVLASLATVLAPGTAFAAASPQDSAAAQSLYDEARKLTANHRWIEACSKLEESQRLDPTQVTQFYLADCYEHAGRTASAWSTFLDLAASAHRTGRADREKVVRERAAELERGLSKVAVDVPDAARVSGLVITRDGEVLREGQWGIAVAVDPGRHNVEAMAPGKRKWTATRDIQDGGQTVTIQVPTLVDEPQSTIETPGPTETRSPIETPPTKERTALASGSSSLWKVAGIVVGGVGIAGGAVGAVFGAEALSKKSEANGGPCNESTNLCNRTGLSLRHDAVTAGNASTIAFVAGGVLIAGGAAMFIFAPTKAAEVGVSAAPGAATFSVQGSF